MNLKEKISQDYMTAFRSKNVVAKNLLSVIKGEIQTQEKNKNVDCLQDEEVIKIINKTVKGLKEQLIIDNPTVNAQVREELAILEVYLPKQMTEDEIRNKIIELKTTGAAGNIAEVMRAFATLPADRQLVSSIFHSIK